MRFFFKKTLKNSFLFKNKIAFISIFLIAAVLIGVSIFESLTNLGSVQPETNIPEENIEESGSGDIEESGSRATDYPVNLLEGEIVAINAVDETITVKVRLFKIIPELGEAERIINIAGAEIVVYNMDTQAEIPADLSELEIGNGVLLTTEESNLDETATRQQYTAVKITKMIKNSNVQ